MSLRPNLDISTGGSLDVQMKRINRNLAKVIEAEIEAAEKGMLKAVTFIQGESQEITPQRKGVLVGGAFSGVARIVSGIVGRIGYTAKHAPFVHEMPDPTGSGKPVNWTKPGTGNKFLEKAVKQNINKIIEFMREFMTI